MRPGNATEHGSSSSFIRSKNSSSAGTQNRKDLGNLLARCSLACTKARISNLLAESELAFSDKLLRSLFADLSKILAERCPFFYLPAAGRRRWDKGLTTAEMKRCHWVRPSMVCQVKFTE